MANPPPMLAVDIPLCRRLLRHAFLARSPRVDARLGIVATRSRPGVIRFTWRDAVLRDGGLLADVPVALSEEVAKSLLAEMAALRAEAKRPKTKTAAA